MKPGSDGGRGRVQMQGGPGHVWWAGLKHNFWLRGWLPNATSEVVLEIMATPGGVSEHLQVTTNRPL